MYIQPQGSIYLYYGYPGDKDYENVLFFPSRTSQTAYFDALPHLILNAQSYTRKDNGVLRIQSDTGSREFLESINYIRFVNTGFSSDYFYGFVDRVEYVNNGRYDVYFTLDVMQTYFIGKAINGLKQCLVERETQATDEIGENLLPESPGLSEYVYNGEYKPILDMSGGFSSSGYVICVMVVDTETTGIGYMYDRVYGGAKLYAYDDSVKLRELLVQFVDDDKSDSVISMFMVPKAVFGTVPNGVCTEDRTGIEATLDTIPAITKSDTLDGYKPKNAKLYTYPYNFLHIDNAGGNELTAKYEYFQNLKPEFEYKASIITPIKVGLRPRNYKGIPESTGEESTTLNTETLVLDDYPLCSWNTDAYEAWLAGNLNAKTVITETLKVAGAVATAGATGGASLVPIAGDALNFATGAFDAKNRTADTLSGSAAGGQLNISWKKQNFYFGRMSVNAECAESIDNYFSLYGYTTSKIKIPNVNVRPHWTYTKTNGCTIITDTATGPVPAEAIKQIENIFNKGVRFWNNGAEVGNYALDNSPQ